MVVITALIGNTHDEQLPMTSLSTPEHQKQQTLLLHVKKQQEQRKRNKSYQLKMKIFRLCKSRKDRHGSSGTVV